MPRDKNIESTIRLKNIETTNELISEVVDIYACPQKRTRASNTTEITLGDLHANAIKLIFTLVREGIWKMSVYDYDQLVNIYCKTEALFRISPPDEATKSLLSKYLNDFKTIVNRTETIDRTVLLRFAGDEVSDRGTCDYLILLILKKLHTEKVPVKILLSNHATDFIEAIEDYDERPAIGCDLHFTTVIDALQNNAINATKGLKGTFFNCYIWDHSSQQLAYIRFDDAIEIVTLKNKELFLYGIKNIQNRRKSPVRININNADYTAGDSFELVDIEMNADSDTETLHLSMEDINYLIVLNGNHAPDYLYGSSIDKRGNATQSLMNLSYLIRYNIIAIDEIRAIFEQHYKPMLCLLDCSFDPETKKTMIFTHAPAGIIAIHLLAAAMGIPEQKKSLVDPIHLIHQYFLAHCINGNEKISSLYLNSHYIRQPSIDMSDTNTKNIKINTLPVEFSLQYFVNYILWNRDEDNERLFRPAQYCGAPTQWVHGHTMAKSIATQDNRHVTNLDNQLGKHILLNRGTYEVLVTTQSKALQCQDTVDTSMLTQCMTFFESNSQGLYLTGLVMLSLGAVYLATRDSKSSPLFFKPSSADAVGIVKEATHTVIGKP